jgi:hypothetical protein
MKTQLDMGKIAAALGAECGGNVSATARLFRGHAIAAGHRRSIPRVGRWRAADPPAVDGAPVPSARPANARAAGSDHSQDSQTWRRERRTDAARRSVAREHHPTDPEDDLTEVVRRRRCASR